MGDASLDLEGVASDGDDGQPQALAGSVVAGGVGAMVTLADMAAAVVDAAARVITAAGCDVTESVTLSDRDRGVTVPQYKRGFAGNKR